MEHNKHYGRHRRVFAVLRYTIAPLITHFLKYRFEKKSVGKTASIIISNHTTDFDPILVGCAISEHMYFVASEHIFRWGFASKLINFLFAPIARTKGQADVTTALTTMRLIKKGHNICIFAEGIRTLTGVSEPIAAATGKLVKASGAQLVTFRLEGGYFTTPAWGRGLRRGGMRGNIVHRYAPEQLKDMTAAEVTGVITRDIYENAYETQAKTPVKYRGKAPAEHLEKVLYLCPNCHGLATIVTKSDSFLCGCGLHGKYDEYGQLVGPSLPFSSVTDWITWQRKLLPQLVAYAGDTFTHTGRDQQLVSVSDKTGAVTVAEGLLVINRDYLSVAGQLFPLPEIGDLTTHGGEVLIFFHKGVHYEIKSPYPRSALLYRDLFNLFKARNNALS